MSAHDCAENCDGVIYLDGLDSVFLEHNVWERQYWHNYEHLEELWSRNSRHLKHQIDLMVARAVRGPV